MWTGCCVECFTAAICSGAGFDMGVLCGWAPVFGVGIGGSQYKVRQKAVL
jgi:hypothetical protein